MGRCPQPRVCPPYQACWVRAWLLQGDACRLLLPDARGCRQGCRCPTPECPRAEAAGEGRGLEGTGGFPWPGVWRAGGQTAAPLLCLLPGWDPGPTEGAPEDSQDTLGTPSCPMMSCDGAYPVASGEDCGHTRAPGLAAPSVRHCGVHGERPQKGLQAKVWLKVGHVGGGRVQVGAEEGHSRRGACDGQSQGCSLMSCSVASAAGWHVQVVHSPERPSDRRRQLPEASSQPLGTLGAGPQAGPWQEPPWPGGTQAENRRVLWPEAFRPP